MTTFTINYNFSEPTGSIVTPPGGVDFSNLRAELAKVPKLFEDQVDLSNPSSPLLEWTGSRLEQVNRYGVDNELTCIWDNVTTENYSKYLNPFNVNNAVIIPSAMPRL